MKPVNKDKLVTSVREATEHNRISHERIFIESH